MLYVDANYPILWEIKAIGAGKPETLPEEKRVPLKPPNFSDKPCKLLDFEPHPFLDFVVQLL